MATDMLATLEYLLEAISSMWSIPMLYGNAHQEKVASDSDNQ
jgi:hypothetical protein